MKEEPMTRVELIAYYYKYLEDTVEERTHLMTNLDTGEKESQEWKGDFDSFMRWLALPN